MLKYTVEFQQFYGFRHLCFYLNIKMNLQIRKYVSYLMEKATHGSRKDFEYSISYIYTKELIQGF